MQIVAFSDGFYLPLELIFLFLLLFIDKMIIIIWNSHAQLWSFDLNSDESNKPNNINIVGWTRPCKLRVEFLLTMCIVFFIRLYHWKTCDIH